MSTKYNNTIKYTQGEKSIKLQFVVYADLECLLEKISTCQNNLRESHQQLKLINTRQPVVRYLHAVHLINQKINSIIIEEKIV